MNSRLFYLLAFFGDLMFFYPFYNMMFYSAGMTHFDVSILIATMQFAKLFFDLPGGLLFDRYGKNLILVLAQLLRILFLVMWIFLRTKIYLFMGMVLWGVSMSCLFGNTEAYMYEWLESVGQTKSFKTFLARYYGFQNVAILVSSFLGSFLFTLCSFSGVFVASVASALVALFILLMLPNLKKKSSRRASIKDCYKSFKSTTTRKSFGFYVLLSGFHEMVFLFFIDLQTNYMVYSGFSVETVSLFVGIVAGLKILANFISGYFADFFSISRIILLSVLVFVAFLSSVVVYNAVFIIFLIIIVLTLYSFIDVSIKNKMQLYLSSTNRGTIMSSASLISSSGAMLLNVTNAIAVQRFGHRVALLGISTFLVLASVLFYFFSRYTKSILKI